MKLNLIHFVLCRNSDDNFLRNIELFDRLALRFSGRVLFLKDVLGSSEICCWSFYGHNQKIAEVCCTSIVYGEQKKHTKVEFPEAKIFAEALNCLLYENRHSRPDLELMEATRMGSGASSTQSDEEIEEMLDRMRTSNNRKWTPQHVTAWGGGGICVSGIVSDWTVLQHHINTRALVDIIYVNMWYSQ